MSGQLNVAMNGILVGKWSKLANGATEFQYVDSWFESKYARAISLSLPLSHQIYRGDVVYNFFDNLLPDNEYIRSRIQQRFNTITRSPFDLLSAIGQDCIGAIQLYQDTPLTIQKIQAESLTDLEIENLLKNYQSFPLGMENPQQDFRISLAGAQEKTALLYHQKQWKRPLATTATSHILKLPIGIVGQNQLDLSSSCENEWLCLAILQKFGLKVPKAFITHFGATKVLVIERFDRRWSRNEEWLMRLPQEDMCQARNIASALKYESDGGLGILQIMELLRGSTQSQLDRKSFFKAQILFWLLCAIDGHAKNFSLFLLPENRYSLTPFYDVISAYPFIDSKGLQKQKVKMAMAWYGEKGKYYLWHKIQLRHIFTTAKLAGLDQQTVEEILHEIYLDYAKLTEIDLTSIPSAIADPILTGLEKQKRKIIG
ncbi:serine/threonine protein kinase [Gallibacterium salpingitidis]|uniref:Serine/threonine protein kinase n=1 Tax=Gallibacterium salpingitidis TaxID=505341 RepID=A0AB36E1P9_9PAST|nr:type II toxin-antitoxin system HipA family toxin [Gallibacterium salpingitidis]OBX07807.1 serine/threonine protein kinase [Gallibacterium salpingitidis]OBX09711.1 serine/threonine protein kinase [Gallibacterium salpingitidis]WKT00867.1 type II toxin-antitoxin system HipA family toxin [Gallibacterium salpingitidis]